MDLVPFYTCAFDLKLNVGSSNCKCFTTLLLSALSQRVKVNMNV